MSSTDYTYDEQGQFFPFFILTLTGLITLPLTYNVLKASKDLENTAPRIKSDYKAPHDDLIQGQKRKQRRKERKLKRIVAALGGYTVMGWMIYLIMVTARTVPKIWDPYDILGVSRSSGEDAIKKHYKRLSLKFHPDKIRPDPARNQTIESLNDYFVELTKAYKALTDEEIRNNYQQYGHPDGKQSFSIGIALPKFMVSGGNGKYVLALYGLLLGVLLPYLVGKWWYGTQRMTKERVLVRSAGNLFQEYKEDLSEGCLVAALSSGEEYKPVLKGNKAEAGLSKVEKSVAADNTAGSDDLQTLRGIEDPVRRKALALLWAYLGRVELGDSTLEDEKYEVPPVALRLNESFQAISLAFGNLKPILSSFHASQLLIQAIPPGGSSLLQLPYFTPKIIEAMQATKIKSPLTLRGFMNLPEAVRRSLCTNDLTNEQYASAVLVGKQLPYFVVSKAFFKVIGEKYITPGSLVQFVVKGRFIPPGTINVPEINELDLEDIDPAEDDVDAINGRKVAKNKTAKTENGEKPEIGPEAKSSQAPLANAPFFARDHSPRWHIFLADSKQGKMAVPPFTFTGFEKPLLDDQGAPTFNMQTLKMQFQAPNQVGRFPFTMHLICDSYVDLDSTLDVTLDVEGLEKALKVEEDDDISEPEEDSLAGQMQAMKTGNILGGAPPSKKKRKAAEESSDDESDTDGEAAAEDSETDTDTDTDGE